MVILLLYNQQIIVQLLMTSGLGTVVLPKKNKRYTRKRKQNKHQNRESVIAFIYSCSDSMFQWQFRL